jgi:hypothetical protein
VFSQRDVYGPVRSAWLTEFPGSVERVDDPNTVLVQPSQVVFSLFGKNSIIWKLIPESADNEAMSFQVAGIFDGPTVCTLGEQPFPEVHEQLSGLGRDSCCNRVILRVGHIFSIYR